MPQTLQIDHILELPISPGSRSIIASFDCRVTVEVDEDGGWDYETIEVEGTHNALGKHIAEWHPAPAWLAEAVKADARNRVECEIAERLCSGDLGPDLAAATRADAFNDARKELVS